MLCSGLEAAHTSHDSILSSIELCGMKGRYRAARALGTNRPAFDVFPSIGVSHVGSGGC